MTQERSEPNGTCPDRKRGRKLQRIYLRTPDGAGLCAAHHRTKCGGGAAEDGAPGAINARRVNLRSGPSTDYRSLGRLDEGTALYVLSQSGSWYRVRIKSSGKTGYIHRLYVTLSGIPDVT